MNATVIHCKHVQALKSISSPFVPVFLTMILIHFRRTVRATDFWPPSIVDQASRHAQYVVRTVMRMVVVLCQGWVMRRYVCSWPMHLHLQLQGSTTLNTGELMVVPGFLGRHDAARPRRAYLIIAQFRARRMPGKTANLFDDLPGLPQSLHGNSSSRASSRLSVACATLQICVEEGRHLHFSHLWTLRNPQSPRPLFDGRPSDLNPRSSLTLSHCQ